jgi:hypothetical protein
VGIVLGYGVAAHHACDKRAKVARIPRRAEDGFSPEALADGAEWGTTGGRKS